MKHTIKSIHVLLAAAAAGLAGLCLRIALYRVGFDDRGLLPRMHPLHLACLILALGAGLGSFLAAKQQDLGYRHARFLNPWGRTFLMPAVSAALLWHAASLFALTRRQSFVPAAPGILIWVRMILALGAAGSIFVILWHPPRKEPVNLIFHCVVCLFFTVDMLSRYQSWSGNPQLPDYLFQILACACLALSSYSRMSLFGGLHNRRVHGFFSLTGLVLCLFCAAGPETPIFYLAGAGWSAAGVWAEDFPADTAKTNKQEDMP